ncbi:MAG TPA: DUF362 domain-containing protein [Bryobacteraceae bacterium]|nr:DUF362 domain-containing protein [Bryobacteraceae bacterium]
MRRRDFLMTAATLGLAGCGRAPAPRRLSQVKITRAAAYSHDIYDTMRRVLAEHNLRVRGRRVVLKPNLVEFEPESTINTHPMLVHATLEAFRELGATVAIAEGPGHRRGTLDLADAAGYFKLIPGFEDLFTDLNVDEVSRVHLARPVSRLNSLYLPHTVLASDLLVSMPKMKTHHWAGATLSMKNLFGVVPGGVYGWPKNVLHWAGIHQCVADLHTLFPRHFSVVDGIVGMDGNGPIQGRPKPAGVIVSGRDPVAVDATCCRIMQIEPARIGYLTLAGGSEGIAEKNIQQIGENPDSVATRFELIAELRELRKEKS